MATTNVTPQAATTPPAASTPSAPPAPPAHEPILPTLGDWRSQILNAEPSRVSQPVESPASPQPAEAAPATPETTESQETAPQSGSESTIEIPDVDHATLSEADVALYQSIMDDLSKQHPGVDEKFMKRAADAQFQVVKMRERIGAQSKDITRLLKDVKKSYKPALVTSLEQSIAAPAAPPEATPQAAAPKPAEVTPAAAPAPTTTSAPQDPVMDLIRSWRGADDIVDAEQAAWGEKAEAQTPQALAAANQKIALIRQAQLRLEIMPLLNALPQMVNEQAERLIQQRFGEFMPAIQQTARERQVNEDMEAAISELEKAGAPTARDLFKDEGGSIEFNGQQWSNSLYNRVVAENPEIMDIVVSHNDPRTANRLTLIKRMKMALRLAGVQPTQAAAADNGAAPTPEQTATLEALTAKARETVQNLARQGLNAGPGASSSAPAAEKPFMAYAASGVIRRDDWFNK